MSRVMGWTVAMRGRSRSERHHLCAGLVAGMLGLAAQHAIGEGTASGLRVSRDFEPATNTITLGMPLEGALTLTTLVGRASDFGAFQHVSVLRRLQGSTTGGAWVKGSVRCAQTQHPDSRAGRSELVRGVGSAQEWPNVFPGLVWFPTTEAAYDFKADGQLLFPTPGAYEIAFPLRGEPVAITTIHVVPPVDQDALAWEALPKQAYVGLLTPYWYRAADRADVADARAIELFLRTYGDSCYGKELMRWAKFYRDWPGRPLRTPPWMSNAWNVVNDRYPREETWEDFDRRMFKKIPFPADLAAAHATGEVRSKGPSTAADISTSITVTEAEGTSTRAVPRGDNGEAKKPEERPSPDVVPTLGSHSSGVRLLAWTVSVVTLCLVACALWRKSHGRGR